MTFFNDVFNDDKTLIIYQDKPAVLYVISELLSVIKLLQIELGPNYTSKTIIDNRTFTVSYMTNPLYKRQELYKFCFYLKRNLTDQQSSEMEKYVRSHFNMDDDCYFDNQSPFSGRLIIQVCITEFYRNLKIDRIIG